MVLSEVHGRERLVMSMLRKVAAVAAAGLLAIGLAACSCSDAGYKRVHPPASQFQSQRGESAQSNGRTPMAPDVLSGDLDVVDNEDGTVTYTYMSGIITVPYGGEPEESRIDVSWGMTVDAPRGMTVSMSLVDSITDGPSVDSYTNRVISTVEGSQASDVKVKGATQASNIVLGDGKTVTIVASNGNTILIGSASSAYGDVSYADEIVSTMRFGE